MLVGNLEGPELTSAELAGTLEGSKLVVFESAGTSASLEQMAVLVWSPVPSPGVKAMEEGPADTGADTAGPGKWLFLGVERARGWKETVGDTGPRVDVGLETAPAGSKSRSINPKDSYPQGWGKVPMSQITLSLLQQASQSLVHGDDSTVPFGHCSQT